MSEKLPAIVERLLAPFHPGSGAAERESFECLTQLLGHEAAIRRQGAATDVVVFDTLAAMVHSRAGEHEHALRYAYDAIATLGQSGCDPLSSCDDIASRARVFCGSVTTNTLAQRCHWLGRVLLFAGRHEQAARFLNAAVAKQRKTVSSTTLHSFARVLFDFGLAQVELGHSDPARKAFIDAASKFAAAGDAAASVKAYLHAALSALRASQTLVSVRPIVQAAQRQIGRMSRDELQAARDFVAQVELIDLLVRDDEAISLKARLEALRQSMASAEARAVVLHNFGDWHLVEGRPEIAMDVCGEARELATSLADDSLIRQCDLSLARAERQLMRHDAARLRMKPHFLATVKGAVNTHGIVDMLGSLRRASDYVREYVVAAGDGGRLPEAVVGLETLLTLGTHARDRHRRVGQFDVDWERLLTYVDLFARCYVTLIPTNGNTRGIFMAPGFAPHWCEFQDCPSKALHDIAVRLSEAEVAYGVAHSMESCSELIHEIEVARDLLTKMILRGRLLANPASGVESPTLERLWQRSASSGLVHQLVFVPCGLARAIPFQILRVPSAPLGIQHTTPMTTPSVVSGMLRDCVAFPGLASLLTSFSHARRGRGRDWMLGQTRACRLSLPRPSQIDAVVVVANPRLPCVGFEIKGVSQSHKVKVVDQDSASTIQEFGGKLRSALGAASHLHVSAHAHSYVEDPSQAYLELGSRGPYRRRIAPMEINSLDLRAVETLMLAACRTIGAPRSSLLAQDLDIAGAFLHAGARSVAATTWPLEDAASAAWSTAFWHFLRETCPSCAIAETQATFGGNRPWPEGLLRMAAAQPPAWQTPFYSCSHQLEVLGHDRASWTCGISEAST